MGGHAREDIVISKYPHECIVETYRGIGVACMENGSGSTWGTSTTEDHATGEHEAGIKTQKHRRLAGRKMRRLIGCLRPSIIVQQRSG